MAKKSKILTERQISIAYKALHKSLESDLADRGLDIEVYKDKVCEYMDLWEHRQQLRNDIAERGVTVWSEKQGMKVDNRSVSLEIQISRQMLAIFQSLGFKDKAIKATSPIKDGDDNDDEL
ncbi:MAG: hypothetical protein KBT02_03175 [Treponema sp.]|nr:hypothetical protein [Candidatus Treponema caballi]